MINCYYLTTCVSAWFGHSPRTFGTVRAPISIMEERGRAVSTDRVDTQAHATVRYKRRELSYI